MNYDRNSYMDQNVSEKHDNINCPKTMIITKQNIGIVA